MNVNCNQYNRKTIQQKEAHTYHKYFLYLVICTLFDCNKSKSLSIFNPIVNPITTHFYYPSDNKATQLHCNRRYSYGLFEKISSHVRLGFHCTAKNNNIIATTAATQHTCINVFLTHALGI